MLKVAIFALCCWTALMKVNSEDAFWTPCERPTLSYDVSVDIDICNATELEVCALARGSVANFSIFFTPNVSLPSNVSIERVIIAKFPKLLRGKQVEVMYGHPVAAENHTFRINEVESVEPEPVSLVGLNQNEKYMHNYLFNVMSGAPKAQLTVRYIIRESVACRSRKKCSNYLRHPGQLIVCIEIPISLV